MTKGMVLRRITSTLRRVAAKRVVAACDNRPKADCFAHYSVDTKRGSLRDNAAIRSAQVGSKNLEENGGLQGQDGRRAPPPPARFDKESGAASSCLLSFQLPRH